MNSQPLKDLHIGVIGIGVVGGALARYFEKRGRIPLLYDKPKGIGSIQEINKADVVFVCVPTPFDPQEGFNLSFVEDVCQSISGKKIIVIKSTVLPGTTEKLQKQYPNHLFLFNPEFLTELTADQDTQYPDRQIIGHTNQSKEKAGQMLRILPQAKFEKILPATEAEMVKYFGNTFFATKVLFANQMYDICEKIGIDYERVKEAVAADPRIGPEHLIVWHKNYRGYGGKCLPKDMRAFIQFGDTVGVNLRLHKLVEQLNNELINTQDIEDAEKPQLKLS